MASAAARFYLVPSNYTHVLASTVPYWGRSFSEVAAEVAAQQRATRKKAVGSSPFPPFALPHADFEFTSWRVLQHVLVHSLARHPSRVSERRFLRDSDFCVAVMPQRPHSGKDLSSPLYPGGPTPGAESLAGRSECQAYKAHWRSACPSRLIVALDVPDIDYRGWRGCDALWEHCSTNDTRVLRVSGGPPFTGPRAPWARCPHVTVPWLAHVRSPRVAVELAEKSAAGTHERTVVVAGAFSTMGHGFTVLHGWGDWRRRLRNACRPTKLGEGGRHTMCLWSYQPPSCKECLAAREAIELYAHSTFCLQPPGDVIARGAIVDAISVGCIPVFFHRAQAALWQWHWNASDASVLFDWSAAGSDESAKNGTAVMDALVAMRDTAATRRMQARVVEAARRMMYRKREAAGGGGDAVAEEDAVDVLVERLGRFARARAGGSRRDQRM